MKNLMWLLLLASLAVGGAGAASRKSEFDMVFRPQSDGNYKLYIFGPQVLNCGIGGQREEKALVLVEPKSDGDPLTIVCRDRQKSDR